ncbi:MAG: antibiotic biosynthesis monooxygenase family protein [Steroidobacteraceae bacterium]|jgi:heme-degrading monooxygenase HmoA
MMAVIFEVWMEGMRRDEYLQIAAQLKSELTGVDGFISVERFESLQDPEKLLSLSFWRDEHAVAAWRNLEAHRAAQLKGRGYVFTDYRLRVASVMRDYGKSARDEAPPDSKVVHDRGE